MPRDARMAGLVKLLRAIRLVGGGRLWEESDYEFGTPSVSTSTPHQQLSVVKHL